MEWFEVRGIYEACLSRKLSEARAAELLGELVDKTVIRDGQRMEVLNIITSDPIGPSDDKRSPYFNRIMGVAKTEAIQTQKVMEWSDGSLEKVLVTVYSATSEMYTTADQRRVADEIRSGPEHVVKGDDGKVYQYGAAVALLCRLLEPAAWAPQDGTTGDGKVLVPMEMMVAAGKANSAKGGE